MTSFQFLTTPAETPVLAVATTVHVGLMLLLTHRQIRSRRQVSLLLPSVGLTATPWLLPSPIGLAVGLLLHLAWLAGCRRLVESPTTIPASAVRSSKPATIPPARVPAKTAPPGPAGGFVQVPVIGVFPETDDITTFRMARPEGFSFEAGQFTSVRVNIDGKPVVRCYSVSSAPEAGGYFEISVKRQGLMSGTLHAAIRPGSVVSVMPPGGGFSYPSGDDRPIALLAGGVGITPLMSMLRHAVHADPTRPVTLIYSCHTHRDIAFRDELQFLGKRHPQAKIVITTTRGPHDTGCLSGRIDGRMIQEQVEDVPNTIFMICGPQPMIDGMTSSLSDLGVPEGQVRSEAFEAAVASTAEEIPSGGTIDDSPPQEFQLRLVESDTTIAVDGRDTLLVACEAAGVELPSACRAGVCGTCRARLVDGNVRCDSDLLDENDRAEGYILPCVAWPESDCAMEA